MKLALFDFDGTITTHDSLIKFIRYSVGDIKFILGIIFLSPMLVAYKLKLIPNYKAKQWMLSYFFKGMNEQKFKKLAQSFSLNQIDTFLRPKAMKKIEWHKEQGHIVVVVSASIECWLKPWCDRNGLQLIGTKMETIDDKISGNFSTKNCYGPEKVNRIREIYNLEDYHYIYAYGDSRGDKELLKLANSGHYRVF